MAYISLQFITFLACLLIVYALTPDKYKWVALLLFSLVFYAASGIAGLTFMLGTSLIVYFAARRMDSIWQTFDKLCEETPLSGGEKRERRQQYAAKSKKVLLLALVLCVGYLCWCKVALKSLGIFNQITGSSAALTVIVPLGVSYYTFSSIGYLVDIHWRAVRAEKSYPRLLLCMIYFPHIVEGPIAKYETLLPQFDRLTFPSYERFCKGAQLLLWGLLKKMVIADRLGVFVGGVFEDVQNTAGVVLFLGLVFAAFQMYADFSGCMDIITGISDMIGIRLAKNFEQPFLSHTVSEFWRRWHISLFNWLKDYIYMPILMSQASAKMRKQVKKVFSTQTTKAIMTIVPTACVFLIIGIWHEVGWKYVLHGLYWTVLFVLSVLLEGKLAAVGKKLHLDIQSCWWHCFQIARTFLLYVFSYVTFTPKTVGDIGLTLWNIAARPGLRALWDKTLFSYGLDWKNLLLSVAFLVLLMVVDVLQERGNVRDAIAAKPIWIRWSVYFAGIFAVLLFGMYGPGYDPAAFIYEKF